MCVCALACLVSVCLVWFTVLGGSLSVLLVLRPFLVPSLSAFLLPRAQEAVDDPAVEEAAKSLVELPNRLGWFLLLV